MPRFFLCAPAVLIGAMFLAEVAGMSAIVAFPALVPFFRAEWSLSGADAGLISGIYFAGYAAAAPVAAGLTDRIDPRRVVLAGMAASGAATLGFASAAEGLWTACLWRALQGAGLAAIHMPGIAALADAVPERLRDRAVATVTASFTVGTAASFFLTEALAAQLGWRAAFAALALGPAAGFALAAAALPRRPARAAGAAASRPGLAAVLGNRRALGCMAAYAAHNAEASAMRAWAVALLAFAQAHAPADALGADWRPAAIAALANLGGLVSILAANEIAGRVGRRPMIAAVMAASALTGLLLGASATAPAAAVIAGILLYGLLVPADSGMINASLVAAADPARRGATMALHALCGFGGAFVGPVLFGAALDAAGGPESAAAWIAGFAAIGAMVALGALAMLRLSRP